LAEITQFERVRLHRTFSAVRLRLHLAREIEWESLEDALESLPRAIDIGALVTKYRYPSRHFVSQLTSSRLPNMPKSLPIICPLWTKRLNWSPRSDNSLVYQDQMGTLVARTLWWRDGAPCDREEEIVRGEGSLVLLSPAGAWQLRAVAGPLDVGTVSWRRADPAREGEPPVVSEVSTFSR
jgi:hypothetical protein